MSDPEVLVDPLEVLDDEEMGELGGNQLEAGEEGQNGDASGLEAIEPNVPERITFRDYLCSPIVELVIGSGDLSTTLHAHQGLLIQSPFFAGECDQFPEDATHRRIALPDDDPDAVASVLEYLYKSDYFPALSSSATLEYDSSIPQPDHEGKGLLRHARVYTSAQRFGLPNLAALSHKKIHLTQSSAHGEIAYARFVYRETSPSDEDIRKPVASFWATRSHDLRHQAETEFRQMCLEFPQFGFDVLTLVLDQQEKRKQRAEGPSATPGTGRKRQRAL